MLVLQGSVIGLAPALVASDVVVDDRLTGRRVCRDCGTVYHIVYNLPKVEDVCDVCGGELTSGSTTSRERCNRLYVYYKQTSPLIGYYFARNLLVRLDADQPIETVKQTMLDAVKAVIRK